MFAAHHSDLACARRFVVFVVSVTCYFVFVVTATGAAPIVTAASGDPYGVATIEIPLDVPVVGQALSPLQALDDQNRVLFPFSEDVRVQVQRPSERPVPRPGRGRLLGRIGNLIREISGDDDPQYQTIARRVTFLFRGQQPIQVRLADATRSYANVVVSPVPNPAWHSQTISTWWSGYTDAAKRQIDAANYPPHVETYLVAMLSGRLQVPLPSWYAETQPDENKLVSTLELIAGGKQISEAIFRQRAAGLDTAGLDTTRLDTTRLETGGVRAGNQSGMLPVPRPPTWIPPVGYRVNGDVAIELAEPVEPLATHVPPECFYIRYGSFENYLWFRDLSDEYGGDISRMVTLSGLENQSSARIESQLNVKTNELSRMLGPTVIEDQAIIGRDLFMNDGASLGVVFQSKNAFLLRTSFNNDRAKRASEDESVTLTDVTIDGRPATLLASADHAVRSFMVEDNGFFLITNSETIARRFFEVARTGQSLAATDSFQLARQYMPLQREDTIFAYFSPEMMRELVSPEYLIELRRRLSANAEIALVHLAKAAARNEQSGSKQQSSSLGITELSRQGYLPRNFGARPDGSGTIEVGDDVMDTLRGARGSFLPIADVELQSVTPEESAWYRSIADFYSGQFPSIDPIMVGVQRGEVEGAPDTDRLIIRAEVAPWDASKYGKYAQQLGPPTRVAMRFAPDDIVAVQAHVASEQLGPPTHLFAAIKDSVPPAPEQFDGLLSIYRSVKQIPGYLGAWPQPSALDRLPLGLGRGQPVGPGMSRLIGGLYRYSDGAYSILSFWPDILQNSLPFLEAVDVENEAQIRVRLGSLQGSQLERWANERLYTRARDGSVAGASFLSLLTRQLGVSKNDVQRVAEQVLGSPLQCGLGGDYRYSERSSRWISDAWNSETASVVAPIDYVAPAMKWFRGGTADVTQLQDRLYADIVLDIARTNKR